KRHVLLPVPAHDTDHLSVRHRQQVHGRAGELEAPEVWLQQADGARADLLLPVRLDRRGLLRLQRLGFDHRLTSLLDERVRLLVRSSRSGQQGEAETCGTQPYRKMHRDSFRQKGCLSLVTSPGPTPS